MRGGLPGRGVGPGFSAGSWQPERGLQGGSAWLAGGGLAAAEQQLRGLALPRKQCKACLNHACVRSALASRCTGLRARASPLLGLAWLGHVPLPSQGCTSRSHPYNTTASHTTTHPLPPACLPAAGLDWDELEQQAAEEDREKNFSDEEQDEYGRKRKAKGGGGGGKKARR